ncbi:hypothetical protein A0H81_14783 [Grifola frondosa]|uniref:Uncharacterized protein n=1 Tax=Grifola frondosa TaxID=5627 RepID=A0A1C7LKH9_GRIFR|nr:hypothetical protein A0H81_14783 [Grifola frondosa]
MRLRRAATPTMVDTYPFFGMHRDPSTEALMVYIYVSTLVRSMLIAHHGGGVLPVLASRCGLCLWRIHDDDARLLVTTSRLTTPSGTDKCLRSKGYREDLPQGAHHAIHARREYLWVNMGEADAEA